MGDTPLNALPTALQTTKYALAQAPPFLATTFGPGWVAGKGLALDIQARQCQQGVLARFPGFASAGPNGSLGACATDRSMSATFGDDANQSLLRAWLLSAFTSNGQTAPANWRAPGWYYSGTDLGLVAALMNSGFYNVDSNGNITAIPRIYHNRDFANHVGSGAGVVTCASCVQRLPAAWARSTGYTVGQLVSDVNGRCWICTVAGESGSSSPFPANPSLGQTQTDGSAPTQITWANTPLPSGSPRPGSTLGVSQPDFARHTIVVSVTASGTAGAADSGAITVVIDGGSTQTYSPIPLQVIQVGPGGQSIQLAFTGAFADGDTYQPSPPDQREGGWARYWLVLPVGQLQGAPRLWGPPSFTALVTEGDVVETGQYCSLVPNATAIYKCTAGGNIPSLPAPTGTGSSMDGGGNTWAYQAAPPPFYDGLWGGPPSGGAPGTVGLWGGGESTLNGQSLYGLLSSLCAKWGPGGARPIGAWLVQGTDTTIDNVPAGVWNEWNATFGGVQVPFSRLNPEM